MSASASSGSARCREFGRYVALGVLVGLDEGLERHMGGLADYALADDRVYWVATRPLSRMSALAARSRRASSSL